VEVKHASTVPHAEAGGGRDRGQLGIAFQILLHEFDCGAHGWWVLDRTRLEAFVDHGAGQQEQFRREPRRLFAQQAVTTPEQIRDAGRIVEADTIKPVQTRHLHQRIQTDALHHNRPFVEETGIAGLEQLVLSFMRNEHFARRNFSTTRTLSEIHVALGDEVE
jgi:hypothetical protein